MLQEYTKIMVGIDGSVESANAFDRAVAVARRNDAELLLVNIIDLRAFQSISTYDTMVAEDTKKGLNNSSPTSLKKPKKQVSPKLKHGSNLALLKS